MMATRKLRILLLQGANLSYLGKREPEIYGTTMAAELDAMLQRHAKEKKYKLEIFYTNIEGEAINRIYQAADGGVDGVVMNPGGFTYAGYALRDCMKGAALPYIEVHIRNLESHGIHSVLAGVANGVIHGFGLRSYILGLDAMLGLLAKSRG